MVILGRDEVLSLNIVFRSLQVYIFHFWSSIASTSIQSYTYSIPKFILHSSNWNFSLSGAKIKKCIILQKYFLLVLNLFLILVCNQKSETRGIKLHLFNFRSNAFRFSQQFHTKEDVFQFHKENIPPSKQLKLGMAGRLERRFCRIVIHFCISS